MAAELLGELQASAPAAQVTVGAERCGSAARPIARRASGAPALWRSSANLHLGSARSAAAARRPGRARRAQRRRHGRRCPAPDPWLPPKVRANLGMPTLDSRIGLAAHDFASALGAPEVLITRARRDGTLADRRVALPAAARCDQRRPAARPQARTDDRALDDPGRRSRSARPRPAPPAEQRPDRISVTAVDRLKADPFAFYAQAILKLRRSIRSMPTTPPRGRAARSTRCSSNGSRMTNAIRTSCGRVRSGCSRTRRSTRCCAPCGRRGCSRRSTGSPRWSATNQRTGRRPLAAEADGEAALAGITVYGRADRIDRLADGDIAIVDYKTGAPPTQKAVDAGFALQLGLLGLIGRAGGFEGVGGEPQAFEYWSLTRTRAASAN